MGVSVLSRLFISSNEVWHTAYALLRILKKNPILKYTTMGPMIPKEMKYNLHYGDVRGDFKTRQWFILLLSFLGWHCLCGLVASNC